MQLTAPGWLTAFALCCATVTSAAHEAHWLDSLGHSQMYKACQGLEETKPMHRECKGIILKIAIKIMPFSAWETKIQCQGPPFLSRTRCSQGLTIAVVALEELSEAHLLPLEVGIQRSEQVGCKRGPEQCRCR